MARTMHMANSFNPDHAADLNDDERRLLARRERVLGAPYRLFYEHPVHLVRGEGVLLYDADGRDYLDAYNNVPVVGHSNPAVQRAVTAQLGRLNTHTRYLTDGIIDYAERLVALFPEPLAQVVFACSGSEAVDLALRMARYVTGREGILATANAYHGTTRAAAEVSPSLGVNNPIPDSVVLVPAPDALRDAPDEDAAATFATRVAAGIDELRRRGYGLAGMIVDSILSSDGIQPGDAGLLAPAARLVQDAGALWIADEVQPGFGRTGNWWGFTRHGLAPDLVVLGKPMGNGLPISAVVGREPVFSQFGADVRYFNTFGGNPVSIAAAAAVLDELESRELLAASAAVGAQLADAMRGMAEQDAGVAQVRQAGLFIAVEFVGEDGTPDAARAASVVNRMREERVLISASGRFGNVLKIRPPLVFGPEHAPRLLDALAAAL